MSSLAPTLTRKQVADLLGRTSRSVLRLDESGALHPIRDDDGNVVYDRAEVDALLRARGLAQPAQRTGASASGSAGALTARVFREFRAGKSLIDVVIDCELTPNVAEDALAAYARLSGAIVVTGDERERLRSILPKTTTARALLKVLEQLARQHHELKRFTFVCATCGEAVQARASVEWAHLAKHGAFSGWTHDECGDDPAR